MKFLLIPLLAAFIYPVATLLLKRVMEGGVSSWCIIFVCNLALGGFSAPFYFFSDPPTAEARWWQPLLSGAMFFIGQIFTFKALRQGDASVATPILGTKVIFVALFTVWLIGEAIPWTWWVAVGLTSLALLFLAQTGEQARPQHRHGPTVIFACLSALCFALTDVLTQKFTPAWGFAGFLPRMFGTTALLSGLFFFVLKPGWWRTTPAVRPYFALGACLLAMQAGALAYSFGVHGHATAGNIVYNLRGIFSVLLVWCLGHWFANEERHVGGRVMSWRLAGAALLLGAIGLVVAG